MQAVILAAGMGKRLKELTKNNTKCMVEINGLSLIERLLKQLDDKGLDRIIIVIGYRAEQLKNNILSLNLKTKVEFIVNEVYDKTNNIYSFYLAKDYMLKDDTLLFESDIIMEDSIINDLINSNESIAIVDKYEEWMDGTCFKIDSSGIINEFVSSKTMDLSKNETYYKTVNVYKFKKDFMKKWYIPFLEAYMSGLGYNEYYEQVLRIILLLDNQTTIRAVNIKGKIWYEIDDATDLEIATALFSGNKQKVLNLNNEKIANIKDFIEHYHI